MTKQKSETAGCLMLAEFLDEPQSDSLVVKAGTASECAGALHIAEFLDHAPVASATSAKSYPPAHLNAEIGGAALYDRALAIYEQLVRQEGRHDLAADLARAQANKAIATRELGEERAAAALTDQTIALYERLVQQEGHHELSSDLSTLYESKASTLCELGDRDRARTYQEMSASLSTLSNTGTSQAAREEPFVVDDTTDPFAIIQRLLLEANRGEQSLAMLRGCELVRRLPGGGMGAVALVQRSPTPQTAELLALKIIRPRAAANPKAQARFLREIEINQSLIHPRIVPLRDWGRWRDIYFFTSEYCDGGDVNEFVRQHGGKLPPDKALPVILQILDALDYAHRAGIVHRDVKPSNIFLCGSGASQVAKLGDFGLARAFATAELSGITGPGALGGTLKFMPKQLLVDFRMATSEIDVWSAGASLYYLLTGVPPRDFSGEPPQRWLWVVRNKQPVPICELEPSIPSALAELIDYALDDQDSLHFSSAAALKQALESAAAGG